VSVNRYCRGKKSEKKKQIQQKQNGSFKIKIKILSAYIKGLD